MRLSRTVLLSATALVAACATGYGVAYASGSTNPSVPGVTARYAPRQATAAAVSARLPAVPEAVFVPVKSCRIVNTSVSGGKIPSGTTRSFTVTGTTGFASQGGAASGCGIPASATAISAVLTSFHSLANGAFAAYPTGGSTGPNNPYYLKGVTVAASATLQLGMGYAKSLTVKATGGPADLAVDVNGYYAEQMGVLTQPGGGAYAGGNRVVSVTNPSTGTYVVTFDTDVSNCTPQATVFDNASGGYYANVAAMSGKTVTVFTYSLDNTANVVPENKYAYLTVTC